MANGPDCIWTYIWTNPTEGLAAGTEFANNSENISPLLPKHRVSTLTLHSIH
jgi:hypothetical protein